MTPTTETWLPVVGYEGLYEVSDLGRVRSLDRIVRGRPGRTHRSPGRALSPFVDDVGRLGVRLYRDGKAETRRISVLVLESFVGPRPTGCHGCHNDGDPGNNQLGNLRWDTTSANIRDAVQHGTHAEARKTHCPRRHALVPPNLAAAQLAKGRRTCLACNRALSAKRRARLAGEPFDMQLVADEYHDEIMRAA